MRRSGRRVRRYFFFYSRRRHTIYIGDWSSDVCSSDLDRDERDGLGVVAITPLEVQLQRGEHLSKVIVQLAGDGAALRFLRLDQLARQCLLLPRAARELLFGQLFQRRQRFLRAPALDRHRHLGGHELKNALFPLAEADAFGIALDDEYADRLGPALERNAQPLERSGAKQINLAALLELPLPVRADQLRLTGAQNILREAVIQSAWWWSGLALIDEIREGQRVASSIVQGDIEVRHWHQIAEDPVNGRKEP